MKGTLPAVKRHPSKEGNLFDGIFRIELRKVQTIAIHTKENKGRG
jgi:hypothetical protein